MAGIAGNFAIPRDSRLRKRFGGIPRPRILQDHLGGESCSDQDGKADEQQQRVGVGGVAGGDLG